MRVNVYNYDTEGDGLPTLVGWFNREKATITPERLIWNGHNNVSAHAGQYGHQALYRTSGGRWVLHTWSQMQGIQPTYTYVNDDDAKAWLLHNESDDVIEQHFGELEEERGPGQPAIGRPVPIRFSADVLAKLDARATDAGVSRAEIVRRLINTALIGD